MRALGHEVAEVKSTDFTEYRSLWARLCLKLGRCLDLDRANERACAMLAGGRVDVCWIDKATTIRPETLLAARRAAPGIALVSYSPDDMTIRPNRSWRFLKCLPLFDVHFTTKPHNVEALLAAGARRVELVGNAFAPEVHRPMPRTPQDRERLGGPVGFIGDYERARGRAIEALGRAGVPVRVWGPNWRRFWKRRVPNVRIEPTGVFGDDYARAVSNFDINLAFLRKSARDEETTRSVEIPACEGFMLAERTSRHMALFEEGREAEFFSDPSELVRKCIHYLARPEERLRIARAGRLRCLESGYSNLDRLRRMFSILAAAERGKTQSGAVS